MMKIVEIIKLTFVCLALLSSNFAQSQVSKKDGSNNQSVCERLDVKRISNVPIEIMNISTIEYITDFVDNESCNQNPVKTELLQRSVDMAYVVNVLNSISYYNASGIGLAPFSDREKLLKSAKKHLKRHSTELKKFSYSTTAQDIARIHYLDCQQVSAMSFERCPTEAFDAAYAGYVARLPNDKNQLVEGFIKHALTLK